MRFPTRYRPHMSVDGEREPKWLELLCRIPLDFRTGDVSVRELFQRAAPDVEDARFVEMVVARLEREPGLVDSWQQYSYDKRGTPSPYLDGTEVGFFEVVGDKARYRAVQLRHRRLGLCFVHLAGSRMGARTSPGRERPALKRSLMPRSARSGR